jgi:RimJ/RimL family protein N-acetyltransferase
MNSFKVLNKQVFNSGSFSLVPIRFEDRLSIMQWRNEQIYHLRQNKPLTIEDQNFYFKEEVAKLFDQDRPKQILFSFLENDICIGYGGLVHINWIDKNAEISFIMNTILEKNLFHEIWTTYLKLIEQVAFNELGMHKIFTYAFDIRPHLYGVLLNANYIEEARLKEHCFFGSKFIDVLLHSKINYPLVIRRASEEDVNTTFDWASNKTVRKYAIQKGNIVFEEHQKWFSTKICSDDCLYLIAEVNNIPIGSIRFDINENMEALLSFLIEPKFHGKGYGKEILEKGCERLLNLRQITKIEGVVSVENIPSLKIFKSLGFNQVSEIDSYITFEKNII